MGSGKEKKNSRLKKTKGQQPCDRVGRGKAIDKRLAPHIRDGGLVS